LKLMGLEHIMTLDIHDLVYCDSAVSNADYAVIDTQLQPQPENLVATINLGKHGSIKYYKDVKLNAEMVIGTVIELRNKGFKPPLLASEQGYRDLL
jgi:hypothetical protein